VRLPPQAREKGVEPEPSTASSGRDTAGATVRDQGEAGPAVWAETKHIDARSVVKTIDLRFMLERLAR
jgi:hypothetical protein